MADNKFILDFIAKVTPDKNSIYDLKNDIKKATGLMDNYNNTVEIKEKSASARRHNVARNQSKQLADNIINDWKSKNIDITSLMGLKPQELDKSFDKVHKIFNKNIKKMQSDLSKSEKEQTKIVEIEEKKRANIRVKNFKKSTYTGNSKYGIPVGMEGHTSSAYDTKYGKVSSVSSEFNSANGLKYRNVVREITDEYGNLVKTTLRYRVAEDQNYYVGKKVLVDKKARLKLEKDILESDKKQLNLEKLMANLSTKHSMSGSYDKSYAGTGKVVGQGVLSAKGLPEGTQRFFQDIDDGRGKIERWEKVLDKSGKTLNTFRTSMKEANRDHKTFAEQIKIATSRIFQWAVATNLVYGSLAQLRQGIGFIVELDNKMNEVRMVTGATADEANRLSKEYNNLASQMGVTTMDVANMANEFYRQGLNQEETNERMKETIKYAKISGMTTQETAEIITASANSYEFAGKEIEKMVDILSYLGDESASGSDEVGRGMQKVAASAKLAGIEYEWLGAKVATISETTRESAETIGVRLLIQ